MKTLIVYVAVMLVTACTSGPQKTGEKVVAKEHDLEVFGTYRNGPGADKGRTGSITIFPNDDASLLFGIDLSAGPPSYNMGLLFDTLKVSLSGGQAHYKYDSGYGDDGCKWQVHFYGDSLTINTVDGADDCGFGNAVYADGTYHLIDHSVPDAYTNEVGDTIYRSNR